MEESHVEHPKCRRPPVRWPDAPGGAAGWRAGVFRTVAARNPPESVTGSVAGGQEPPSQVLYRPLPDGWSAAAVYLGPQAGCAGGGPRRVQADRHHGARLADL